ncbi:hypothetical protein CEXT_485901 [Caerostris extrusa]|uniref:Uncharacterized protein n=1 Tax=Caerostris extrusa TaxID=172846 RepID=A0AAV4WW84_CAEEX|nr:hypothetical protein CEXT_485901 [Caerostris extrusa]
MLSNCLRKLIRSKSINFNKLPASQQQSESFQLQQQHPTKTTCIFGHPLNLIHGGNSLIPMEKDTIVPHWTCRATCLQRTGRGASSDGPYQKRTSVSFFVWLAF